MSSIDPETFSAAMARLLKAFSDVVETVAEALRECIARGFRNGGLCVLPEVRCGNRRVRRTELLPQMRVGDLE